VSRRKQGRAYVYTPQVTPNALRRLAFQEFLEGYFDGSKERLLAFLHSEGLDGLARPAPAAPSPAEDRLDTALL